MSSLPERKVVIEVCGSQTGGTSLIIGDNRTGHRLSGGKVGGMETLYTYLIDALELIDQAVVYGNVKYESLEALVKSLQGKTVGQVQEVSLTTPIEVPEAPKTPEGVYCLSDVEGNAWLAGARWMRDEIMRINGETK